MSLATEKQLMATAGIAMLASALQDGEVGARTRLLTAAPLPLGVATAWALGAICRTRGWPGPPLWLWAGSAAALASQLASGAAASCFARALSLAVLGCARSRLGRARSQALTLAAAALCWWGAVRLPTSSGPLMARMCKWLMGAELLGRPRGAPERGRPAEPRGPARLRGASSGALRSSLRVFGAVLPFNAVMHVLVEVLQAWLLRRRALPSPARLRRACWSALSLNAVASLCSGIWVGGVTLIAGLRPIVCQALLPVVALTMPLPLLAIQDSSVQDTLFAVYVPCATDFLAECISACGLSVGHRGGRARTTAVSAMAASVAVALTPESTEGAPWGWLGLVVLLQPLRRAVAHLTGFPLFAREPRVSKSKGKAES